MRLLKLILLLITSVFFLQCNDNGCIERVNIPDNVLKISSGFIFEPASWIDLPCDYDTTEMLDVSEILQNFSHEIISYNFTPDTGNNTSKLEFEILLKNNNNFEVEGLPIFIMRANNVESSVNYTGNNSNCSTISPNQECTFSYAKETSFDTEKITSLELVSVKFLLAKE